MPASRLQKHDLSLDHEPQGEAAARGADPPRGPDRAGRIESAAQLDGVIQRSASANPAGGALEGSIAGAITAQYQHGEAIEGGAMLHTGAAADQLTEQVGSTAFTVGRHVFMNAETRHDPEVRRHELAHVEQQGGGDPVPHTIGAADTEHEQAAQAGGGAGGVEAGTVQRYTDTKEVNGEYARVSDNGNVIVLGESNFSQQLYATEDKIKSANAALAKAGEKGSYLSLIKTGESLRWGGKMLKRVAPVFKAQGDGANTKLAGENKRKDEDDTMSLWADCGRSSRVVMGSHADAAPHAVYKTGKGTEHDTAASYNPATYSDEIYVAAMPRFMANPANADYLKSGVHYSGDDRTDLIQPSSADEARKQYWELGAKGRRAFDKFAGINTAADPSVGGGYTMATEYNMPGFEEKGDMTWNFHWAGVVMEDGSDNITLENYADGKGYDSINTDWNFQMYGTVKKGQTFHEQHLASNTHGSRASTFSVEPKGD